MSLMIWKTVQIYIDPVNLPDVSCANEAVVITRSNGSVCRNFTIPAMIPGGFGHDVTALFR